MCNVYIHTCSLVVVVFPAFAGTLLRKTRVPPNVHQRTSIRTDDTMGLCPQTCKDSSPSMQDTPTTERCTKRRFYRAVFIWHLRCRFCDSESDTNDPIALQPIGQSDFSGGP